MTWQACSARVVAAVTVISLSANLCAQTQWMQLRNNNVLVRGQISITKLNAVACDLETARQIFPSLASDSAAPQVVAVDSARAIREWLPEFNERRRGNPLGAYWHGLYGDHIVIRIDTSAAERLRRVLHEYAHFVTQHAVLEPPRWLDEGVSEIWEHVAINDGAIEIGRPVKEHLKHLRSGKDWIPVHQLLNINEIPTRTNSAWEMFYAESWALTHYLMFEKRGADLRLDRLANLENVPSDAVLQAYVRGPLAAPATIVTPTGVEGCRGDVTAMPILESFLDRAKALADGERPDAAIPLLQSLLAINKDNADALEAIGFVHFKENRPSQAASVFDRLISSGTASFISYYYRAVLAGPIPIKTGGGTVSEVEYLRKALALNPGFPPAVQRLNELGRGKEYLAVWPWL
jgi:tetratricopeptide (TPR) repeat protein